jgi:hypothetical protein
MFKKFLLASAAVVGLAGAAQAQIPSVETSCARPDLPVSSKVICSSPRLKANAQRNLNTLIPLARNLSGPETIALLQNMAHKSNEHMTYCRVPLDRMPALPISQATENCLAGWQDIIYAELQRGMLPDHNPATASSAGLTGDQQALISKAQQKVYEAQAAAYNAREQAAVAARAYQPPVAVPPAPAALPPCPGYASPLGNTLWAMSGNPVCTPQQPPLSCTYGGGSINCNR